MFSKDLECILLMQLWRDIYKGDIVSSFKTLKLVKWSKFQKDYFFKLIIINSHIEAEKTTTGIKTAKTFILK